MYTIARRAREVLEGAAAARAEDTRCHARRRARATRRALAQREQLAHVGPVAVHAEDGVGGDDFTRRAMRQRARSSAAMSSAGSA
jgi:hypothetical protein